MKVVVGFFMCAILVLISQCAGASKLGVVEDVATSPTVAKAVKSNSNAIIKVLNMAWDGKHKLGSVVLMIILVNRRKRTKSGEVIALLSLGAGLWAARGWLGWPFVVMEKSNGWRFWASDTMTEEFSFLRLIGSVFVALIAMVVVEMLGTSGVEVCEETAVEGVELTSSVGEELRDDENVL